MVDKGYVDGIVMQNARLSCACTGCIMCWGVVVLFLYLCRRGGWRIPWGKSGPPQEIFNTFRKIKYFENV